jgi:hypothetical protein
MDPHHLVVQLLAKRRYWYKYYNPRKGERQRCPRYSRKTPDKMLLTAYVADMEKGGPEEARQGGTVPNRSWIQRLLTVVVSNGWNSTSHHPARVRDEAESIYKRNAKLLYYPPIRGKNASSYYGYQHVARFDKSEVSSNGDWLSKPTFTETQVSMIVEIRLTGARSQLI